MSFGFPELDASLNAASGLLLCAGYGFIKRQRWRAHGWTMACATLVSAIFLICYLTYHYQHGEHHTSASHAAPWLRNTYRMILFPHLILAIVMLPMIFLTLRRAYRRNWDNHRRLARKTIGIWLFVSVTGVIVYLMLYHTALAT